MRNVDTWLPLFESEDLQKARVVATCVASMEYEVRVNRGHSDRMPQGAPLEAGPFVVLVPAPDLPQLSEVLDEIILEQEEFDTFLDNWRLRATRREQQLLITMIVIVSALAIAGAIDV